MKLWDKFRYWQFRRSKHGALQDYTTTFQRQIQADYRERGIPTDLEGYRTKFRRNLLGHWKTGSESESFSVTEWQFFADGSAQQLNTSSIVGDTESRFLWREKANFIIEMRQANDDDETDSWFPVHYNFKSKNGQIVLLQIPEKPDLQILSDDGLPALSRRPETLTVVANLK